jgi:hypothetical protein
LGKHHGKADANVALFAWLISHQPAVLLSHNKPATSNQPAVLFSQNKPAPAISHQPTEQAVTIEDLATSRLDHMPMPPLLVPTPTKLNFNSTDEMGDGSVARTP